MKYLPEVANLKQSRTFAWIFYGEVAVLASGVFGLTFGRPQSLTSAFFMIASTVFLLHAVLIWAWGRRYPLIDGMYVAWNITTIAVFSYILIASQLTIKPPSATSDGMYIGRPSTFIAVVILLMAIGTRSAGIFWSTFAPKAELRREESRWPAFCFLIAFIVALIGWSISSMQAPPSPLDFSFLLYFLSGGMDGARVFM